MEMMVSCTLNTKSLNEIMLALSPLLRGSINNDSKYKAYVNFA